MYVYMFESLATTFREYKTLRMSEFYGMIQILLNPQPTAELALEPDFQDNEEERIKYQKMVQFYETYQDQYNSSQREVLQRVAKMPINDICLIQGPVSTFILHLLTVLI